MRMFGALWLGRLSSSRTARAHDGQTRGFLDGQDGLVGFCQASGLPEESEWGAPVAASPLLIDTFEAQAKEAQELQVERRLCHHLENYHSLRNPHTYPNRLPALQKLLQQLQETAKSKNRKESFDMESAVLFRVAKDAGKHALSILQTVHKEDAKCDPYDGPYRQEALKEERNKFGRYIFQALLRIPLAAEPSATTTTESSATGEPSNKKPSTSS